MASLARAREIAEILKQWIEAGQFELTAPVRPMPTGRSLNSLEEKIF